MIIRFATPSHQNILIASDSSVKQCKTIFISSCFCGRQVDCALSLVRLGKERHIPGLQLLCDDLVTMETLVYETSCDLSLTLRELQQLSDIDKLHLLMKNVSAVGFFLFFFLAPATFSHTFRTFFFSHMLDFF